MEGKEKKNRKLAKKGRDRGAEGLWPRKNREGAGGQRGGGQAQKRSKRKADKKKKTAESGIRGTSLADQKEEKEEVRVRRVG